MRIDPASTADFLSQHRIAVAGVSDDPKNFGRTIYGELRNRGYDVVALNPNESSVLGDPCYSGLAEVPGAVDGVIVMVPKALALDVVRDCAAMGVRRVWLFKGVGGAGSVSAEAVQFCINHGIEVIAGACPLMFLEPVHGVHRLHRGWRRLVHA